MTWGSGADLSLGGVDLAGTADSLSSNGVPVSAGGGSNAVNAGLGALTMANPIVGGVVAGLKGIMDSRAAVKQRKREAAATLGKQQIDIEQTRSSLQSTIISNLARGLSSNIRGR